MREECAMPGQFIQENREDNDIARLRDRIDLGLKRTLEKFAKKPDDVLAAFAESAKKARSPEDDIYHRQVSVVDEAQFSPTCLEDIQITSEDIGRNSHLISELAEALRNRGPEKQSYALKAVEPFGHDILRIDIAPV